MSSEQKDYKWVGTRQIRPDGHDKVTGRGKSHIVQLYENSLYKMDLKLQYLVIVSNCRVKI